jgi:hypothetical protein
MIHRLRFHRVVLTLNRGPHRWYVQFACVTVDISYITSEGMLVLESTCQRAAALSAVRKQADFQERHIKC